VRAEARGVVGGTRRQLDDSDGVTGLDRVLSQPNTIRRGHTRSQCGQCTAVETSAFSVRQSVEDGSSSQLVTEREHTFVLLEHLTGQALVEAARQSVPLCDRH
jgi:hypothetical protein